MGGSALVIYGSVDDRLLQPRPAPRSMIDRLMGRTRMAGPTWIQLGRDRQTIDLPADQLAALGPAFIAFVASRLDPPWAATASVLQYLALNVITVYVRGDKSGSDPARWYVQLTFSGCAGMAEVSAELAVHWADRWYRENKADIVSKYFRPYGFEPDGRTEGTEPGAVFVPMGAAGYALLNPTPHPVDEGEDESRYFDIDWAAVETIPEAERPATLRALDEQVPPLIPAGACCCQLCAPQFHAAACDRLAPF